MQHNTVNHNAGKMILKLLFCSEYLEFAQKRSFFLRPTCFRLCGVSGQQAEIVQGGGGGGGSGRDGRGGAAAGGGRRGRSGDQGAAQQRVVCCQRLCGVDTPRRGSSLVTQLLNGSSNSFRFQNSLAVICVILKRCLLF